MTFAGCVLAVFVLYWGPAIFVPFALAILLTFVLTPPVTALERWVGRVPAVLVVVTLVFTVLGLAGWAWRDRWRTWPRICRLSRQHPNEDRGRSRRWQRRRRRDAAGNDRRHQAELGTPDAPKRTASRSVVVTSEDTGYAGFAWLGPIVGPLGTAGLVLVTVIFMLLERRDLRDRLIGLFGHGRLAITTKPIDEAGTRVS